MYTGRIYFCTRHTGRVLSIACTQRDALCTRSLATRSTTLVGDLVRDSAKGKSDRERKRESRSLFARCRPKWRRLGSRWSLRNSCVIGISIFAPWNILGIIEWISIVLMDDIYHFLILYIVGSWLRIISFSEYFRFIENYSGKILGKIQNFLSMIWALKYKKLWDLLVSSKSIFHLANILKSWLSEDILYFM